MKGYIAHINERNENARLTGIYNRAVSAMNEANSENEYKAAAEIFKTVPGFKDADSLVEKCLDNAEICRKRYPYNSARSQMTGNIIRNYESAIRMFESISGWKRCRRADLRLPKEDRRTQGKRKPNDWKRSEKKKKKRKPNVWSANAKKKNTALQSKKGKKKAKKVFAIGTPIVCACVAFLIVLTTVIIPNNKYSSAVSLMNDENMMKQ